MAKEQIIKKIVIIGSEKAGKTWLSYSLTDKAFPQVYKTTIAVDFYIKNIETTSQKVRLEIWDTAGAEQFDTLTRSCLRNSSVILIAINPASIQNATHQLDRHIGHARKNAPKAKILYVVTQWDLAENLSVTEEACRNAIKDADGSQTEDEDILFYSSQDATPEQKKTFLDTLISAANESQSEDIVDDVVSQGFRKAEENLAKRHRRIAYISIGFKMLGFLILFAILSTIFLSLGGVTGGVEQIWADIGEFFNAIQSAIDLGAGVLPVADWGIGVLVASIGLAFVITVGSMTIDYYRKAGDEPGSEIEEQRKKGGYSGLEGGTGLRNVTTVHSGPLAAPQTKELIGEPEAPDQKENSGCTLF